MLDILRFARDLVADILRPQVKLVAEMPCCVSS
jgi:hypothetical protein